MSGTQGRLPSVLMDPRVWGVASFPILWMAIGVAMKIDAMIALGMPAVYPYLFVLQIAGGALVISPVFWVGFVLYCFVSAAVLVSAFDWVRGRLSLSSRPSVGLGLRD